MSDDIKRRVARLEVAPEIFMDLCKESEWPRVVRVTENALPAGAELVGVEWDTIRGVWRMGIRHWSYDIVEYGVEAPLLPPVTVTSSLGEYQRIKARVEELEMQLQRTAK